MKYIIITPAHNKEKYVCYTLDSVVKYTLLTEKWIIVNDGSTDRMAKIIKKHQFAFSWIKLVRNPDPYAKGWRELVAA